MEEKQVYENQETAIKLLEENVELKKRIKEVEEILNNKRSILITQLLNGEYPLYEELLYQVDEEIRRTLDKGDKNE